MYLHIGIDPRTKNTLTGHHTHELRNIIELRKEATLNSRVSDKFEDMLDKTDMQSPDYFFLEYTPFMGRKRNLVLLNSVLKNKYPQKTKLIQGIHIDVLNPVNFKSAGKYHLRQKLRLYAALGRCRTKTNKYGYLPFFKDKALRIPYYLKKEYEEAVKDTRPLYLCMVSPRQFNLTMKLPEATMEPSVIHPDIHTEIQWDSLGRLWCHYYATAKQESLNIQEFLQQHVIVTASHGSELDNGGAVLQAIKRENFPTKEKYLKSISTLEKRLNTLLNNPVYIKNYLCGKDTRLLDDILSQLFFAKRKNTIQFVSPHSSVAVHLDSDLCSKKAGDMSNRLIHLLRYAQTELLIEDKPPIGNTVLEIMEKLRVINSSKAGKTKKISFSETIMHYRSEFAADAFNKNQIDKPWDYLDVSNLYARSSKKYGFSEFIDKLTPFKPWNVNRYTLISANGTYKQVPN